MEWSNISNVTLNSIKVDPNQCKNDIYAISRYILAAEVKLSEITIKGNQPSTFLLGRKLLELFKLGIGWSDTHIINIGPLNSLEKEIMNSDGTMCEGFYNGVTVYYIDSLKDNEGYVLGNVPSGCYGPGIIRLILEEGE